MSKTQKHNDVLEKQIIRLLAGYPDVLSVAQISQAIGYSAKTISGWRGAAQKYHPTAGIPARPMQEKNKQQ